MRACRTLAHPGLFSPTISSTFIYYVFFNLFSRCTAIYPIRAFDKDNPSKIENKSASTFEAIRSDPPIRKRKLWINSASIKQRCRQTWRSHNRWMENLSSAQAFWVMQVSQRKSHRSTRRHNSNWINPMLWMVVRFFLHSKFGRWINSMNDNKRKKFSLHNNVRSAKELKSFTFINFAWKHFPHFVYLKSI